MDAALSSTLIQLVTASQNTRKQTQVASATEFLALKHESRILGQWYNPVSGSRKSNASY